ncbi:MAG TPA: hypothetical protein VGD98_01935 [Ktedonobacteraceae bacterium]
MIPHDEFTPHGYLDNPYHSWKLNPSGVLRSLQPLGMGWHMPNLGSYVNNQFQYTAHLTVGLKINDLVLITPEDFRLHRCVISSSLHTKNRLTYTCRIAQYDLTLAVTYFLVQEHALGCVIELASELEYPLPLTCYLVHLHTHNPHTSRLWEHGWYALPRREEGYAQLGLASEGDVFTHGARAAGGTPLGWGEMGFCADLTEVSAWANGARVPMPNITQRDPETGWQPRALALPCALTVGASGAEPLRLNAILARAVSQDQSYAIWDDSLETIARAEAGHREDDENFWQSAPQLSGAWPANWRRGLVYDLETLRMTLRPSAGVVGNTFDGMQIQAPRLVLAEAAMDALFLSYADPELAAEVLLTHFESAPRANLPCMREDGSYNMVADDGQICGTAPEWGYPLWVADQLWQKTGNLAWLRRLYPGAAAFLRWWLDQRRDAEGWLTYACSWESGQDVSSRFGPQQTGGTIIQHVRPVDLQASMAQGAAILASWAEILTTGYTDEALPNPYPADIDFWQAIATEFTVKTRLMWRDGWFRDYDAVAGIWSSERDAMHLAAIFCDTAGWGQIEQLRPILAEPPQHSSQWAPLSWPPVVMTLIGATAAAQMPQEAAELAYRFIDASYRSTDSRELDEHGGLPGVTREYRRALTRGKWGEIDYANAGIEGYGWGALSIHLLIRHLLGLRAADLTSITLAPTLPQTLRSPGSSYKVAPIPWGNYLLSIECQVKSATSYTLELQCSPRIKKDQLPETPDGSATPASTRHYSWEGTWGEERTLQLDS